MLKKTTVKLSLSILGSSIIAVVVTFVIIMTFGYAGSSSVKSSSSSGTSSAISLSSAKSAVTSSMSAEDKALSQAGLLSEHKEGGLITDLVGRTLMAIVCLLIYIGAVYGTAWREGDRDPNRVSYDRMQKFMAKGLVAGLLASVPYAIIYLAFLISNLAAGGSVTAMIFSSLFRISNLQYVLLCEGAFSIPAICFIFLLPMPIIAQIGYMAGYKHFSIMTRLIYKNNKKAVEKLKK